MQTDLHQCRQRRRQVSHFATFSIKTNPQLVSLILSSSLAISDVCVYDEARRHESVSVQRVKQSRSRQLARLGTHNAHQNDVVIQCLQFPFFKKQNELLRFGNKR
jgi:hypothetical protein